MSKKKKAKPRPPSITDRLTGYSDIDTIYIARKLGAPISDYGMRVVDTYIGNNWGHKPAKALVAAFPELGYDEHGNITDERTFRPTYIGDTL